MPYKIQMLAFLKRGAIPGKFSINENDNNIIIRLGESSNDLNEVVVVGYSDKKRSELTSAVSVVKADKLKDVTTNDVGSLLQSKVAGLEVVNSSGVPGASAEIRLRGVSSVNATQSPLYVVDGIIGGNFDPNDVESISVLKDAAATAMYGLLGLSYYDEKGTFLNTNFKRINMRASLIPPLHLYNCPVRI